jgi:group I intron endonuclease
MKRRGVMPSESPLSGGRIYLLIDKVGGKVYVGQTTQSLKRRWTGHFSEAKRARSPKPLYQAMRKHGQEAFTIQELEWVPGDAKDLSLAEARWVTHYNSANPDYGYNLTQGGGQAFTLEARQHMSEARRKTWANPDSKKKQLDSLRETFSDPAVKAEHATAVRRIFDDPQVRKQRIATLLASTSTPEAKAHKSASMKARWSDEAYRTKVVETCKAGWAKRKLRLASQPLNIPTPISETSQ